MAKRERKTDREIDHFRDVLWHARANIKIITGSESIVRGVEAEERIYSVISRSRVVDYFEPMPEANPRHDFKAIVFNPYGPKIEVQIDAKAGYFSLMNTRKKIKERYNLMTEADVDKWLIENNTILVMALGSDEEIIKRFESDVAKILESSRLQS